MHLLCDSCERELSRAETKFSNTVFNPYVEVTLDENGLASGDFKSFEYSDWFLRFSISISWRTLLIFPISSDAPTWYLKEVDSNLKVWRDFLLRKRDNSGSSKTYFFFLQNIGPSRGPILYFVHEKASTYLMRAVDIAVVSSKKQVVVYSKIGPMFVWTTIGRTGPKSAEDCRVKMSGLFSTATSIYDPDISKFVTNDRPKIAAPKMELSPSQKEVVKKSFMNNLERASKSMTLAAYKSDMLISQKKRSN